MSRIKMFLDRRKNDYDFKTVIAALGSLAVTTVFAFYNGFLGVFHSSLWHGTICVYYIVLVFLRGIILSARIRVRGGSNPERAQKKVFVFSSALLLFLNICLIIPVFLMVVRQKPVNMSLIQAIAMAAYTTYKTTMASVNLRKIKRSSDSFVRLLRTISFIEALVAILALQNTLIMVKTKDESTEMLIISAISSAAVMLTVLALSVTTMIKGVLDLRRAE